MSLTQRSTNVVERLSPDPVLSPREEIAVLARALYRSGWTDFNSGHITYVQPDETLLMLPFERGWNEVTASDVLRIDFDGEKIEGPGSVPIAVPLHVEFHKARPGSRVTLHQHPQFTTMWSTVGTVPPVYDQRGAFLSDDDFVIYDDYSGPVDAVESARSAVQGMGERNIAILRNHGAFIAADSIAQAYTRATALEWRCRMAWFVRSVGGDREMPLRGREALSAGAAQLGGVIPLVWEWAVRRELRADLSVLEPGSVANADVRIP